RGGLESLGGREGERSVATRLPRQPRRASGRGRRSLPVGGGHLGGENGTHPGVRFGREWQPCHSLSALLGERDRPASRQLRGADDRPTRGGGGLVPPSAGADGLQRGWHLPSSARRADRGEDGAGHCPAAAPRPPPLPPLPP